MRLSLHRFPRESKVAAVVLGAALLQVGVLAAIGLKSTSDRQEAFARELADNARPVAQNVVAEAAQRVREQEARLGRELAKDDGTSPWVRVQTAMEQHVAPVFQYAYLIDASGRLTDFRRAPYEMQAAGPRDEAARARLAEVLAIEKSDPARALKEARALADALFERPSHDSVAAALALQAGWRAAYAMKDRDAARLLAKTLLARYRSIRADTSPIADSEPMGPAASAVLCGVLYDSLLRPNSNGSEFVDAVIDRRDQAQRLRPLLSDAAYRIEVEECAKLTRDASLLPAKLWTELRTGIEKCDALDQSTERATLPGKTALRTAAAGEDAARFVLDSHWLLTVIPLPQPRAGDPIGVAFVAPPLR